MVLTCTACSAKLSIPSKKVPKSGIFSITCPQCHQEIRVKENRFESEALPESQAAQMAEECPVASVEDEAQKIRGSAMICVDPLHGQMRIKTALAELGYTVHIVNDPKDAIDRILQKRDDLVILHEEYGGSPDHNSVLQAIQPLPMSIRRFMYVGLIGRQLRTLDPMAAFVRSVNFVVADQELGNLKAIVRLAVSENNQFFRALRETLQEVGKR
jgi:hypothetical protein